MVTAMYAEEVLAACPFVDAVFEGEGEMGLAMLCQARPYEEIDGLVYRKGGGAVRNRKAGAIELDGLPLSTFGDMSLDEYWNPEPVVPVVFSRGCRWRRCRFCAHNFSYGPYRRRDVDRFVEYLSVMRQGGIRHFYFADQYVGADDMKAVADEIVARGLDVRFHFMGRPDSSYTPEILAGLSQAGCRWISWGVESGSQRLLDVCGKGTRVEDIRRVIHDAHAAGISNLLMMIFGMPTSCDEDLEATLDFLDDVADGCDDVTNSSFQLFAGTPFGEHPEEYHLTVTGQDVMFMANGTHVHSARLYHSELAADGSERPARGSMELDRWRRRRKMSGWNSRVEGLCCEHYLLYAARRGSGGV
jgi:anaerobic magnesium-protoporphyrin IX monomethyl ester cyclase